MPSSSPLLIPNAPLTAPKAIAAIASALNVKLDFSSQVSQPAQETAPTVSTLTSVFRAPTPHSFRQVPVSLVHLHALPVKMEQDVQDVSPLFSSQKEIVSVLDQETRSRIPAPMPVKLVRMAVPLALIRHA